MSVSAVPEGFHTITPNVIVDRVDEAVSFYKTAFAAEEVMRLTLPDGRVVHCELKFGDSRLNVGMTLDGWPAHALLAQIFVDDSDAVFKRVVDAGCKPLTQVTDMFFGFREGRVIDPFGNTWTISTRKESLSPAEMQRRLDASFS
jgi:PhnB protein